MRRVGFGPSRKNPGLCNTCFEKAPMGGVEMEIGVLFADVRGFTSLAETMGPGEVAELLNRFYASASRILSRSAVIDKLVGDQVMALYIPQLIAGRWEDEMLRDARELLAAVGFGSAGRAVAPPGGRRRRRAGVRRQRRLRRGQGLHRAWGRRQHRLAASIPRGARATIVMSERLFGRLSERAGSATAKVVEIRGKQDAEPVRVIEA